MKKNQKFLIIFLLLSIHTVPCFSQPPVAPNAYVGLYGWLGEKEFVTYFIPGNGLSEGMSGANINWDFTGKQNAYNTLIERRDPKTAPHASSFPNATTVELVPLGGGDTLYIFHYENPPALDFISSVLGSYQINGQLLIIYGKPRILTGLPLKIFGDSISNAYSAQGTFDSAGITGTITRHGNIKRYYDAYGSLKTEYNTYSDDGRMKIVETYTDSIVINGKLQIHHTDEINFIWTNSTDPVRHASITHITRDGKSRDEGFFKCLGCKLGINVLNGISDGITIYPQPAGNSVVFGYNFSQTGEFNLSIIDINGKIVAEKVQVLEQGTDTITLNTSSLADGIYLVRLSDERNIFTKKFVVNH